MPPLSRALLVLLAAIPSLMTARRIWSAFPGSMLTANDGTVLQDYIVMWVSGRTALAGQTHLLATTEGFNAQIAALVLPGIDTVYWVYPPTMLLLSTPLAVLPPFLGMAAWTVLTLGALWVALRLTALRLSTRIAVMVAPAVLENVVDGQNGALLTACAIGAITQAQRRPWLAGLCMSAAVLKPQMAIVAPLCALAAWHWRALIWAGAFAIGWAGLAAVCFGPAVWVDYATSILPNARNLYLELDSIPFGTLHMQSLMVTPFAAFRSAGCSTASAELLQLTATALVLGVVGYRAMAARRAGEPAPLPLALASIPLVTPYAMTYDMIGPAVAAALLLQHSASLGVRGAAALAWVWPGLALYVSSFGHPGLGALAFAGLFVAVLVQGRRSATGRAPGSAAVLGHLIPVID